MRRTAGCEAAAFVLGPRAMHQASGFSARSEYGSAAWKEVFEQFFHPLALLLEQPQVIICPAAKPLKEEIP